jgi:hypothetical protein
MPRLRGLAQSSRLTDTCGVASDEELQRWAAGPEEEAVRAQDPVLRQKGLGRWVERGNRRILVRELYVDERLEAGVVATLRGPLSGPLVLTDRRLLYVSERVVRRPLVVSIERRAIKSITVQEKLRYGTIHVETADASFDFRLVRNEEAWEFVGHWLAGLDNWDPSGNYLLAMAVEDRPRAIEIVETTVTVTAEAQALIAAGGGTLYLWQKPFNDQFATDKFSLREPPDVDFCTLNERGPVIRVATDVPRPREVEVGMTRWPRRRVKVMWDGELWGRRGFTLDGGA